MPAASREFQVFVKPGGAACNLDCRYCYYLEKRHLYPADQSPRMSPAMLERYIVQHLSASADPVVTFSWHGGEPTVLGVDYFRGIVALQRKHAQPGQRVVNAIQTNGLLIDHDWCRFFAAERFRVGLSLDGPADVHDAYRVTHGREPTHDRVMRAFELLQRYRIPCDILCAVHSRNVREPTRVYRFFRKIGARYLGFLPVVRPQPGTGAGVTAHTVPAEAYGSFLCTIFDEWRDRDQQRIMVQLFDEAMRPALGIDHSLCIFRRTCGEVPVVEHNGDFYSCDHFVDPAHQLGNIAETPLAELLDSPAQRAFGNAKWDSLPRQCRTCEVLPMCNGGCPKDRFTRAADGEEGLNYLCPGLSRFFHHVLPYAVRLAAERRRAPVVGALLKEGRTGEAQAGAAAGRNDPCPCGSGKKYKKCCLVDGT
jgi:uncharacterized protein